jgi:hypothetical protein
MRDVLERLAATIVLLAATAAAGCGLLEAPPPLPTPTPPPSNVIFNPGFEAGAEGWNSVAAGGAEAAVDEGHARAGERSLLLALDPITPDGGSAGAVQQVQTTALPEYLSGWYRVERWDLDAEFVYLQFVVRLRGAALPGDFQVHELRFIIAGAERDPEEPPEGAAYVYLSRDDPERGEWTYFGYPVRQTFASRFGAEPTTWESMEIALEARYVRATDVAGDDGANVLVLIDDLFAGPFIDNPNQPD